MDTLATNEIASKLLSQSSFQINAKNYYALATLGDWFKISCKLEPKPKPKQITRSMHNLFFSHPLSKLQVIVRNSDNLVHVAVCFCCDWPENIFLGHSFENHSNTIANTTV